MKKLSEFKRQLSRKKEKGLIDMDNSMRLQVEGWWVEMERG